MSWSSTVSSSAIILLSASANARPSLSLNLNPLIIDINIIMSRKMKMKRRQNSVAVSGLQLQQLGVVGMGVVGGAPTQSQSDSHIVVQDNLDALLRVETVWLGSDWTRSERQRANLVQIAYSRCEVGMGACEEFSTTGSTLKIQGTY